MIVDYGTLQQRVAAWLARSDLTAAIPDFIQLAEANLSRELRARKMQVSAAGTSAASVIPMPADCVGIQSLRIATGGGMAKIHPVAPDRINGRSGIPNGYAVVGDQILLNGSDVEYMLVYRRRIPALSDSNQQNWLIIDEPGAYLYAALVEASPYLADDARVATWAAQYQRTVDGINAHYDMENYGNAPAMVVSGHAP